MSGSLNTVISITEHFVRARGLDDILPLTVGSSVCQDALIFGIDVDDYVADLEMAFGQVIREIPWLRFTDQTSSFRGCAVLLVPFWLVGRLPAWLRGEPFIPRSDPRGFAEHLTLGHIARVIDAGGWIEP